MKRIACYLSLIALLISCSGGKKNVETVLYSPDGRISFNISAAEMTFQVLLDSVFALENSPFGIIREDQDFSSGLELIGVRDSSIEDSYTLKSGKKLENTVTANEKSYQLKNAAGERMDLIVRAYNEGIAFRYYFPGENTQKFTVKEEKTGFKLPFGSKVWVMPYDSVTMYAPAYETYFTNGTIVGMPSPSSGGWSFPLLFNKNQIWALITESEMDGTYCASHLDQNVEKNTYRLVFPSAAEALGNYPSTPSSTLPWKTPWRVVILAETAGGIAESNLVTHLASPSVIGDDSWVRPGLASWSWWSDHASSANYNSLKRFIDISADMKWPYSLVDANWNIMKGGTLEQLVEYAAKKGVGLLLWYNSGGTHNNVTEQPRDLMNDPVKRKAEFQRLKTLGIKGVKVDFFQSDKQEMIRLYIDILKDAAEHQIMVNFHGCTLPRGWQRTYPNLVSMEAVRGAENYAFDPRYPALAVIMNNIYPYTRNVVGSMDYTPVAFSNQTYPHVTSYAHELALPIVFESGIQHIAEASGTLRNLPKEAKDFLSTVPNAWDETRFLVGEPGSCTVVARRSGSKWYIGGINGDIEVKTLQLNIPADGEYTLITNAPENGTRWVISKQTVTANTLTVSIEPGSGFVLY
ncbi:MAG: glycoside hydrolase family 97 catalytic domain-containing protein [Bacteroidales bacterium]|nr:glycoside hydrolase family 97 catalytic domain-containing protein [Bacteroidales bacterium]